MTAQEQDIDSLLAEIARSQGGSGSSAFPTDTMTSAILERLREEVAKVYSEQGGGAGGAAGGAQDLGDGASASPRARVQVRHPLPVELWRRAHEVEGKPKPVRGIFLAAAARRARGGRRRRRRWLRGRRRLLRRQRCCSLPRALAADC